MALRPVTCPSCQHAFKVVSSASGEKPCPKCGAAVALGDAPAAAATAKRADSHAHARSGGSASKSSHKHRHTSGAARAKASGGGKLPLLLGGGALVLGLGLWLFMSGGDDAPKPIAAAAPPIFDLSKLPDLEPLEGTDPGDWEKMKEMMTRYSAPPWTQNSQQYGDRLMMKGRFSVPAILNGFKRLDFSTQHGADVGWKIQTMMLQGLCKDTNFGWHRATRPEDVAFNHEVVQRWFEAWKFAGDDDALWAEVAKNKGVPSGQGKAAPARVEAEAGG